MSFMLFMVSFIQFLLSRFPAFPLTTPAPGAGYIFISTLKGKSVTDGPASNL